MRRLNLLPYRALARQRRCRGFYRLLAGNGLLALLILVAAAGMLHQRQRRLEARALWLTQQTQALQQQVRSLVALRTDIAQLRQRVHALGALQRQRLRPVLLLRELAALTPPNVVLQSLRQTPERDGAQGVILNGYADTGISVATLMDALRDARWLRHPQLQEMHHPAGGAANAGNSAGSNASTNAGSNADIRHGRSGASADARQAATGVDFRIDCTLDAAAGDTPAPVAPARAAWATTFADGRRAHVSTAAWPRSSAAAFTDAGQQSSSHRHDAA